MQEKYLLSLNVKLIQYYFHRLLGNYFLKLSFKTLLNSLSNEKITRTFY
jgi:hypothetical protein